MKRTNLAAIIALIACCTMSCTNSKNQQIPIDPAVRYGQLDNGLTYYIRHNEEPKNRAEFHLAQAVGATLEEDHQNGLAHFLEHMAFNGTTNFPGKGIINYFESVGLNFGGDINAYTSLDETVYRLSNVPTTRQGIVDSALLVMHDWASGISMHGEEIDAERGVIREEWRTGANAERRMWKKSNSQKYPGSRYAVRDVIGDTAVINNFSYEALRDYYKLWYGPDLQAVVIVGDIDVDSIEAQIKELWADVPARANRGERPIHGIADNKEPIVAIVTDKEAQYTRVELEYKHEPLSREQKLSMQGAHNSLIEGIVSTVMSYRFSEITQKPDAKYIVGASWYTNLTKSKDGFVLINIPKPTMELQATKDLMIEAERLKRYGITKSEFNRAKADIEKQYEKTYNERNNTRNAAYTQEYIRNFLDAEIIPGIEWEYKNIKTLMSEISYKKVNEVASTFVTDENMIISFMLPENANTVIPAKEDVLKVLAEVKAMEIEAPKEDEVNKPLVAETPEMGEISASAKNESLGTTELTLSNGVKVVIKTTDFKQDEILMTATSEGGYSLVANIEDLPSAMFAADVIGNNGIGEFSSVDLQKKLTGKIANVSPSISEFAEKLSGNSSVTDFETMLQLAYLYFTAPRQDDEAFQALLGYLNTAFANKDKDPKSAFRDSISTTMSCHSPRTILVGKNTVAEIDQMKAIAIFEERFANAADFTFYFTGNINANDKATQEAICTWLGGLKTSDAKEKFADTGVRSPKGHVKNYFKRDMEIKTASNRIEYTGAMEYTLANRLNMNVISEILSTRYLESIREKEGGSYGVGVGAYIENKPMNQGKVIMQFDTDPLKQKKLMSIIHKEVDLIIAEGPRADDLSKIKENLLKDYAQDIETNAWWHHTVLYRFYEEGVDYNAEYKNAIEAVTAETIQATLKQIANQKNEAEIVMMPQ